MVFSHQSYLAHELCQYYERVIVITRGKVNAKIPQNASVISFNPKFFNNTPAFLLWAHLQIIKLRFRFKPFVVFSHMNETFSAFLGPLLRLFNVRHVMWYAHKATPLRLRFALFFVDSVVTSTLGSFRIPSKKVRVIGQAIDVSSFLVVNVKHEKQITKWCHIGRLDPSKDIESLILLLAERLEVDPRTKLTLYGEASGVTTSKYPLELKERFSNLISIGQLSFAGHLDHANVPLTLKSHNLFVHAYRGSLDKSVLEATAALLPTITVNPEYLREFNSWSGKSNPSLQEELDAFLNFSAEEREQELLRRQDIVITSHSLQSWTRKILPILRGDTN